MLQLLLYPMQCQHEIHKFLDSLVGLVERVAIDSAVGEPSALPRTNQMFLGGRQTLSKEKCDQSDFHHVL